MQKRILLFLTALLLLIGCAAPAPQAAAPQATATEAAVPEAPTEAPTEAPKPTAAPTEAPAPAFDPADEFMLDPEPGTHQLTIYWKADKINFDTSDMWIWYEGADGHGYKMYPCAYGGKCVLNVPDDVQNVGFIVRTDCSEPGGSSWGSATKDYDGDRFIAVGGKDTQIYLLSGDGAIYFSEDGGVNLYQNKTFTFAGIVDTNKIKYRIEPAMRFTDLGQITVRKGGEPVAIESVSSLNNEVVTGTITLTEDVDITAEYEVELDGYGTHVAIPTDIFDSAAFIENYTYDGNDLGATLTETGTTFKVWAPTASKIVLNLFENGDGGEAFANVDMTKGERGVWQADYACGHGTYYTYTVTTAVGTQEAVDPYAKAVGLNGNRGMVIDLASTDPAGFREAAFDAGLTSYRDAIIWEVHVRDFSNKIATSKYPGKYLAFTERGLTNASGHPVGVDYLVDLGITHVHLQPIYDYATVNEANPDGEFNWGYDPKNYNAPEGSYSTDPYHGEVRVNELKQMVQSLHEAGLAVVMDVVYNHTYDGNSSLNRIVPYYYYRYTAAGENANGSGCGNETASNRVMFRKFKVDSVTYWQTEYRIDGFRIDLMGLHDGDTMQAIEVAVHENNPQAILYGEGWTGGTSPLNPNLQATQANIRKVTASEGAIGAVAVFNDAIRDGLKGSVFDAKAIGYISGDASKGNANKVLFGVTGGAHKVGASWNVNDALMINYMSSHDNRTLWDILRNGAPDASDAERAAMNRLGAGLVLTSKGTPFWLAGEEMLRTKNGDENSYKSSDAINNIDWDALQEGSAELDMVEIYKALIRLRKANPWLYNSDVAGEVLDGNAIAATYTQDGVICGFMAANPTDTEITVTLPDGEWLGLYNAAGDLTGTVTVPAKDIVVLRVK